MRQRTINLLLATSSATGAVISEALRECGANVVIHHAGDKAALLDALGSRDYDLVLGELELADYSAPELAAILGEKNPDVPLVLIKGSGAEEIAIQCMAAVAPQFIYASEPYLQHLPVLMEAFIGRAAKDGTRRQVERKLLESEERYLDIFDNTSDLIQCVAPDGYFIYTNRAWRNTMGYSEEEVASLTLLDVLHPDSMACCQDRFARLLQGETLNCIDFMFVTKSGETVHLEGDCGSIIKAGEVVSTRGIFKNITGAVRAEEALRRSEARYLTLYDNAPDIYMTIDASGEILSINRVGAGMLGYQVDELIGESAAKVVHPEDQRNVFCDFEKHFKGPDDDQGIEYRLVRKDGSVFWAHQRISLEVDVAEPRLFVICRDVTEKRSLEAKLAHQASHDMLTNLVNRREFERRLQQALSGATDPLNKHALCFLDLDQFKIVNDTCGHMAGDELLRQVATLLEGRVRPRDTLARLGGDEFAILLEHCSLENAAQLAEALRETIAGFEFHWRSQRFSFGVSIGVVPIRGDHHLMDILNLADAACYQAKKEGRNRVHVHDPAAPAQKAGW